MKDFYNSAKPVVKTAVEIASVIGLLAPEPGEPVVDVQMARYQFKVATQAM